MAHLQNQETNKLEFQVIYRVFKNFTCMRASDIFILKKYEK